MRTIIDLSDEQLRELKLICAREGISRAEAVRRAVALLISEREERMATRAAALAAARGSWKGYGIDGVEYQRQIRAEWDRD